MKLFKAWCFVKRDIATVLSYRTSLVLTILSGLLGVVQFSLMARFIASGNSFPLIQEYGGDFLSYVVIGSIFTSFVGVALGSFQNAIRTEQQLGTLEHLLLADLPLSGIMIYSALWNFVNALLNTTILFAVVIVLFRVRLYANLTFAALVLVLTVLALSGIGMTSAGIILVTKQGDPVGWLFTTLTSLVGGVLFPVETLPRWVQPISQLLPTTHALRALRLTLTVHAGWTEIRHEVLSLVLTLAVTLPLGLLAFHMGLKRAKRAGSLAEY